jgi:GT2 family glycosyltransferase
MDVTVIIVTYNSAETIGECLTSVQAQIGVQCETIVVDNASTDGTTDVARKWERNGLRLFANQENIGFGRANNQGFAASSGRYLYLLNPDAQLTKSNALAELRAALEQHLDWGMSGTKVVSADRRREGKPANTYPGQKRVRRDFSKLPGRIAWVSGASMFLRRQVFAELGGFDPDFFLYNEETDLCLRLREKGYVIGYVDTVEVTHVGGVSERANDPYQTALRRLAGLHLFWQKHYSKDDMIRLARVDQLRAGFRMLSHGLLAYFRPAGSRSQRKRQYYRALWISSSEFLKLLRRGKQT